MTEPYLYLTTTGRKTGLPRKIEIWFVVLHGRYYLMSQDRLDAKWVKNLLQEPTVSFIVRPRDDEQAEVRATTAVARVVDHDGERDLVAAVVALMNEKYSWSDGHVVELTPTDRGPESGGRRDA